MMIWLTKPVINIRTIIRETVSTTNCKWTTKFYFSDNKMFGVKSSNECKPHRLATNDLKTLLKTIFQRLKVTI